MLGGYATIAVLLLVGLGFVSVAYAANRLIGSRRSVGEGLLTYECGVDPVGDGWAQTQIRYYVYAFLYVVFAVEAVFLYPWATIFAQPGFGVTALVEMAVFIGFLAVALLYAWRKRVLSWT